MSETLEKSNVGGKDEHRHLHDPHITPLTILTQIGSSVLLVFSIVLVTAMVFTGNTHVAKVSNPWVALIAGVSYILRELFVFRYHPNFLSYILLMLNYSNRSQWPSSGSQ